MNYCSNCSAPVMLQVPDGDDRPRYVCNNCGQIHYQNPKVVVGCIPLWQGRILLCRRDIEPRRGYWTLPAGYLENGETAMAGAARETLEETGAVVSDLEAYLHFDIVHIGQIYMMFRAQLECANFHPTEESSQVVLFYEDEIPWDEIAFPVIEKTLHYFYRDCARGAFPFRIRQIEKKMAQ